MGIEDIEHFIMQIASNEELEFRGKEANKLYSWSHGAKWMRDSLIKCLKEEMKKHKTKECEYCGEISKFCECDLKGGKPEKDPH